MKNNTVTVHSEGLCDAQTWDSEQNSRRKNLVMEIRFEDFDR